MAQQRTQRGSITQRAGKWVLQYRKPMPVPGGFEYRNTKAILGSVSEMTQTDARIKADELIADAAAPARSSTPACTVKDFVDAHFRPSHVESLTPAGRAHYEFILSRFILPALGDVTIRSVRPAQVQGLINSVARQGKSHQTLIHIKNVLSALFKSATVMDVYPHDLPTTGVRVPRSGMTEPQSPLSPDQLSRLIASMEPRHRPLIVFLANTGMRIGEALGLQWDDINFGPGLAQIGGLIVPAKCVAVLRSFGRYGYGKTKTARAKRIVPLTEAALEAVLANLGYRHPAPEEPVFQGENGQPLDAHNVAARFLKPAGKKAGVPWVHWHTFRHTVASLADLDLSERQRALGHASIGTTVRYAAPQVEKVRAGLGAVDRSRSVNDEQV